MAYREAAGWLGYVDQWIHPRDLALRDAGFMGAYPAATIAERRDGDCPLRRDQTVAAALRLATFWRRLAERWSWQPLLNHASVQDMLAGLGWRSLTDDAATGDLMAYIRHKDRTPRLLRTAHVARNWINSQTDPNSWDPQPLDAVFLAACMWRRDGYGRAVSLPFWSAGLYQHQRLASAVGTVWITRFLETVRAAALTAHQELGRLRAIEARAESIRASIRSKVPAAIDLAMRTPIITVRGLARRLALTPQGATGVLDKLVEAGVLTEITGRKSWRVFATP
jgi:HTH DNA binding domain